MVWYSLYFAKLGGTTHVHMCTQVEVMTSGIQAFLYRECTDGFRCDTDTQARKMTHAW